MAQTAAAHGAEDGQTSKQFWALALGSIGVVYGDIGTSPLYALREAVTAAQHHGTSGPDAVLGILSLMTWTLVLIVTVKYVIVLLNADNKGEGGTFALMALGQSVAKRSAPLILVFGVVGAAFFYGDAVITPAISVLSAVEGLKLVAPALSDAVLPITIAILVGLFAVQSRGTAAVAQFFGPITLIWFIVLAIGGMIHLIDDPRVFLALNPALGVEFVLTHGVIGLAVMGLVFLVATGAEALYADLGHFGRKPIQFAWLAIVQPALIINYFGQGALLLAHPEAIENPFYRLYPRLGPDPHGRAGDPCHRHRQPGRHHRRLLVHAPGHPAGIAAPPRDSPHVGERRRPDLSAACQPGVVRRRRARDLDLPQLEQPRRRLRPVRHRDHGHRQPDGLLRGVALLGLAGVEGGGPDGAAAADRAGVSCRQRHEDPRGRLDAAARRGSDQPARSDVGARLAQPRQGHPQERGRPRVAGAQARRQAARIACPAPPCS